MSIERRNPLPAGLYWVDVFDPNREAFAAWLKANSEKVKLRVAEHFGPGDAPLTAFLKESWVFLPATPLGVLVSAIASSIPSGGPARDWGLFQVLSPVDWDSKRFGYPTIAPSNIQSSQDTASRPDPEPDITDTLPTTTDIGKGIGSALEIGGMIGAGVVILAAGLFLWKVKR